MNNRFSQAFVVAIFSCLLLPMSIRTQNAPALDTIECGKLIVKDYPLPGLVQTLFRTCNKQISYTENLPDSKVTINCAGAFNNLLDCLGTRSNLIFQPVLFVNGAFQQATYTPGQSLPPDTAWFVGQTTDPAKLVGGEIRIYLNPKSNEYHVLLAKASVKELLDRLHRLYGSNSTLTADVVRDLYNLGLDFSGKAAEFKVTLALKTGAFDGAFRQRLTKALYQAWLEGQMDIATDVWPLTFLGGRGRSNPAGNAGGASTQTNTAASIEDHEQYLNTVELLNEIFGENTVRLSRQNLFITGSAETRLQAKRLLARIDSPWPQVQMTMWTIQVSGKPDKMGQQLLAIKAHISQTKEAMAAVHYELNALLAEKAAGITDNAKPTLDHLKNLGFERQPSEALSLNEALILLAIHPEREQIVTALGAKVKASQGKLGAAEEEQKVETQKTTDPKTFPKVVAPSLLPLPRLKRIYANSTRNQALLAIEKFSQAHVAFQEKKDDPQVPANLQRESAVVDRLLKAALDAYSADLEDALLQPLLERLQRLNGGTAKRSKWNDEGVTLTGRARIVVTSRLSAELAPTLKYYANVSRPKPYDLSTLNKAFPNNTDGKAAPRVPLLDLETFPALLLAAALSEERPVFSEVAPGIKVSVRPTVHPDGASARLILDCNFGVMTSVPSQQQNDIWGQSKADAIESHRVNTDASVGVFDLFDISSFSFESSHPQAPFYIPVLGRLPIVGPAFQFPREKKRVHQESIILVNTVILPRALDLARHYGDY